MNLVHLHKPRWHSPLHTRAIEKIKKSLLLLDYKLYSMLLYKEQHNSKSSTRDNDAIKRHSKQEEMCEAAASITQPTIL